MCGKCDRRFEHIRYALESLDFRSFRIGRQLLTRRSSPDLREKRARLQSYEEYYSSVLSPVRKLPPEDLVESPQLWSNISIGRTRFPRSTKTILVALFLKQSANRPVSVTIPQPADGRLVGLVSRHANRWDTLRLSSPDEVFYTSLSLNGCFLPMLEKLEILETTTESPDHPIKILHRASNSNLRHVVLKNALVFRDLPWSQLTRLRHNAHVPHRPHRASLTSLTIIGQWTPANLTDFLARSQCHLTLGPGYMKDNKIIDVLQILPSLSSLVLGADIGTTRQLQNRVITDKLLRRLIFYPDSDSVLPSLTFFSLKTSINFEHQVTELCGVAVSRIARVDLEFCGKTEKQLDPASVAVLSDLAVAGLRVSFQQSRQKILMLPVTTESGN
ncbi:hypothetical protein B0H14DRAFT_2560889 [Mycena olivaceomarginata]|nr:hypothetical protein B0H14DRAFT_2560889 [Mycena olivaceomarginata]